MFLDLRYVIIIILLQAFLPVSLKGQVGRTLAELHDSVYRKRDHNISLRFPNIAFNVLEDAVYVIQNTVSITYCDFSGICTVHAVQIIMFIMANLENAGMFLKAQSINILVCHGQNVSKMLHNR